MQTNQLRAHPANRLFLELVYAWFLSLCLNYGARHLTTSLFSLNHKLFKVPNPKPTCPSSVGSCSHPSLPLPPRPCSWPLCGHTLRALHGVWGGPLHPGERSKPSCQGQCLLTCWPHHPWIIIKPYHFKTLLQKLSFSPGKYVQTSLERWGICSVRCENMDSAIFKQKQFRLKLWNSVSLNSTDLLRIEMRLIIASMFIG